MAGWGTGVNGKFGEGRGVSGVRQKLLLFVQRWRYLGGFGGIATFHPLRESEPFVLEGILGMQVGF